MDFLKDLFGSEALTYEQFASSVSQRGYKLADLSTGSYVGKHKYEDDISAKNTAIEDLKSQIKTRDSDIQGLKDQIVAEGDNATKLTDLTAQLEKLQGEYTSAKKDYETRLGKQSYEFAVKEYANAQEFTSNAAKRDFINEMISENLKMKNGTIIGADDFMKVYSEANSDAFVTKENVETTSANNQSASGLAEKPTFVQPTAPRISANDNPFENAFNFAGIRPKQ